MSWTVSTERLGAGRRPRRRRRSQSALPVGAYEAPPGEEAAVRACGASGGDPQPPLWGDESPQAARGRISAEVQFAARADKTAWQCHCEGFSRGGQGPHVLRTTHPRNQGRRRGNWLNQRKLPACLVFIFVSIHLLACAILYLFDFEGV
jgi:hypothetical protein